MPGEHRESTTCPGAGNWLLSIPKFTGIGVIWNIYTKRGGSRPLCLPQHLTDSKLGLSDRAAAPAAVQAQHCSPDIGGIGSPE